jgi:hypothetical protein
LHASGSSGLRTKSDSVVIGHWFAQTTARYVRWLREAAEFPEPAITATPKKLTTRGAPLPARRSFRTRRCVDGPGSGPARVSTVSLSNEQARGRRSTTLLRRTPPMLEIQNAIASLAVVYELVDIAQLLRPRERHSRDHRPAPRCICTRPDRGTAGSLVQRTTRSGLARAPLPLEAEAPIECARRRDC